MTKRGIPIAKTKKPPLRTLAEKKINELEKYAIDSSIARKIGATLFQSSLYRHLSRKLREFRDYKLKEEVLQHSVPKHVAIIMDGNRRFAQNLALSPEAGHIFGKEKLEDVLEWCLELKIEVLTVYAFSTENFSRSTKEIQTLMTLCKEELDKAKNDSRIHKNNVRIRILGHLETLPLDIQQSAQEIMDLTKDYTKYSFNIALAYGGREEILQAIQQIAHDVKENRLSIQDISESTMSSYLYTNGLPDPDLILRTSGEERISNFLLWQLAYSELYFSDVYWPALQKRDFLKAIQTYQNRQRRYGT